MNEKPSGLMETIELEPVTSETKTQELNPWDAAALESTAKDVVAEEILALIEDNPKLAQPLRAEFSRLTRESDAIVMKLTMAELLEKAGGSVRDAANLIRGLLNDESV
jgi:hypothetical protein